MFSCSWRYRREAFLCRVAETAASTTSTTSTTDSASRVRMTVPTMRTVPEATKDAGMRNSSRVSYSSRDVRQ